MPKYGYVVVEGPHDVELVYRLLSPHGLASVQLDGWPGPFLAPLVPTILSPGGRLLETRPGPAFLAKRRPMRWPFTAPSGTRD